jgi:hypothetical protein
MGEEEAADADPERLCQGISLGVAACTYPATVRCTSCKKWFCDAHAEDEQWYPCMLSDSEERGSISGDVVSDWSGRAMARSGLRMMPTFPLPSL